MLDSPICSGKLPSLGECVFRWAPTFYPFISFSCSSKPPYNLGVLFKTVFFYGSQLTKGCVGEQSQFSVELLLGSWRLAWNQDTINTLLVLHPARFHKLHVGHGGGEQLLTFGQWSREARNIASVALRHTEPAFASDLAETPYKVTAPSSHSLSAKQWHRFPPESDRSDPNSFSFRFDDEAEKGQPLVLIRLPAPLHALSLSQASSLFLVIISFLYSRGLLKDGRLALSSSAPTILRAYTNPSAFISQIKASERHDWYVAVSGRTPSFLSIFPPFTSPQTDNTKLSDAALAALRSFPSVEALNSCEATVVGSEVAAHYNARENIDIQTRTGSRVYHLKNFNNWIKSVLIAQFCPENAQVLDLCGGKGGDMRKFLAQKAAYWVLADHATSSVHQALDRYNKKRAGLRAMFIAADCFLDRIDSVLPSDLMFDLVSCQFCIHYSFETEARARALLYNVSCRLKPSGHYVGTCPNANRLVKRARQSPDGAFGNKFFRVSFTTSTAPGEIPVYGARYIFSLEDAIDECPEFLVHFPTLEQLAAEYGLELVYRKGFHELFEEHKADATFNPLLYKMFVLNSSGSLSEEEWEVAGIYDVFCFVKKRGFGPEPSQWAPPPPRQYTKLPMADVLILPGAHVD